VHEIEVKLAAGPSFRLPNLSDLAEVDYVDTGERRYRTTYLDTADLRLARWGVSFRHRTDEGWTVKLPGSRKGRALARPEVRFDGGLGDPPSAAVDLVRVFTRGAELVPRGRLRTNRRVLALRGKGSTLMEVMDDNVVVLSGRRVVDRFRELEVEMVSGPPGLLEEVTDRLREAGADPPEQDSKAARAIADDVSPEMASRAVDPSSTGADVVRATLTASVRRLVLHDPVIRIGEDPEGVHQARIALRRIRSDLKTLAPLLQGDRTDPLADRVKALAAMLGGVRDADVLLGQLESLSGDLREEDRAAAARFLGKLEGEREMARSTLLGFIDSSDYDELVEDLISWAHDPPLEHAAEDPASDVLPALLKRRWKALRKAAKVADQEQSDESLHRVRIKAKRLRYAAEVAAPVLGKQTAAAAKAAEDLQDVLGTLQDSVVARGWLRGSMKRGDGPQGFVAGLLTAMVERRGDEAREGWKRSWKRLKKAASGLWS
jgi:CHAD domain-containing protein